jgi:hypothetical protein
MILIYTGIFTIIIAIILFFVLKYIGRTRKVNGPKIVRVSDCKDDTIDPEVYGPRPANYTPHYFCKVYMEDGSMVTDVLVGDPQSYIGTYHKITEAMLISKWYWIGTYILFSLGVLQLVVYLLMYLSSPRY